MPRKFAVNNNYFSMAAQVVISLLIALLALTLSTTLQAQGPALTTISGTVYRADGTAASGTVLVSWPSFQTAEGNAVAAGNLSVTLRPLGAFTAQLVPNVGASPAGTYYVVVFQLDDGTVRTEYWAVPATSPTTIAAVLMTPGTGLGNLAVTQEYVNAAVATVGSGAYVSKAGDTMSGPLTLPADLTGETSTSHLGHRPYRMSTSFAWNFLHQTEFLGSRRGRRGGTDTYYAPLQPTEAFPFGHPPGATGGAWSWRRDAFNIVGGMLDTCILGSADWHQAFGLVQATNVAAEMRRCTGSYVDTVLNWQARAAKLNRIEGRSPMGCIDNFATHAFHGSKSLRAYGERWALLQKWDFNPTSDIARDYQGLWRWTGNKPGLRDEVARYFIERSEDGALLLGEAPLV